MPAFNGVNNTWERPDRNGLERLDAFCGGSPARKVEILKIRTEIWCRAQAVKPGGAAGRDTRRAKANSLLRDRRLFAYRVAGVKAEC